MEYKLKYLVRTVIVAAYFLICYATFHSSKLAPPVFSPVSTTCISPNVPQVHQIPGSRSCPAAYGKNTSLIFLNKENYDSNRKLTVACSVKKHTELDDKRADVRIFVDLEIAVMDKATDSLVETISRNRSSASYGFMTSRITSHPAGSPLTNQSIDIRLLSVPLSSNRYYVAKLSYASISNGRPSFNEFDDHFKSGWFVLNLAFQTEDANRSSSFKLVAFVAVGLVTLLLVMTMKASCLKSPLLMGMSAISLVYTCPFIHDSQIPYEIYRFLIQIAIHLIVIRPKIDSPRLKNTMLYFIVLFHIGQAYWLHIYVSDSAHLRSFLQDSDFVPARFNKLRFMMNDLLTLKLVVEFAALILHSLLRKARLVVPPADELLTVAWLYFYLSTIYWYRNDEMHLHKLILDYAYVPLVLASLAFSHRFSQIASQPHAAAQAAQSHHSHPRHPPHHHEEAAHLLNGSASKAVPEK